MICGEGFLTCVCVYVLISLALFLYLWFGHSDILPLPGRLCLFRFVVLFVVGYVCVCLFVCVFVRADNAKSNELILHQTWWWDGEGKGTTYYILFYVQLKGRD